MTRHSEEPAGFGLDRRNTRAALEAIGRSLAAVYRPSEAGLDRPDLAAAYARLGAGRAPVAKRGGDGQP